MEPWALDLKTFGYPFVSFRSWGLPGLEPAGAPARGWSPLGLAGLWACWGLGALLDLVRTLCRPGPSGAGARRGLPGSGPAGAWAPSLTLCGPWAPSLTLGALLDLMHHLSHTAYFWDPASNSRGQWGGGYMYLVQGTLCGVPCAGVPCAGVPCARGRGNEPSNLTITVNASDHIGPCKAPFDGS